MATRPPGRRPTARRPAARTTETRPEEARRSATRTRIIIVATILTIVGLVVGIGYYLIYVRPFQLTIIKVDDTSITVDYLIRRLRYGSPDNDVFAMIQTIINEELIRQGAPRYGIDPSPEEVDQAMRDAARGENESISEAEFRTWYRNQLNESKLSDAEFRQLFRTYYMRSLLQQYLAERMPTVAEQIHLHLIIVDSLKDAEKVVARLDEGADFTDLAREVSTDDSIKELGGDLGWWPELALRQDMRWTFGLEVGQYSTPVAIDPETGTYGIYMVSERAAAREIDEEKLPAVQSQAVEEWLTTEIYNHEITLHGRNNGFDSETHAWIMWQLSRLKQQEKAPRGPTEAGER